MNAKLIGFFSGFPTHHFPEAIAAVLKDALFDRESLVFVSAWPDDFARNDDDSDGMHAMFAEQDMPFSRHSVIDRRTAPDEAVRMIREASCIFLMGGEVTFQFGLIKEKGIFEEIRDCSAVILGVSAGSMNLGKHVVDFYESLTPYDGLDFADLTIKAHYPYDEEMLNRVKRVSMELPVCAMEDESAIFIDQDRVFGIGQIHRISGGEMLPMRQEDLDAVIRSHEQTQR